MKLIDMFPQTATIRSSPQWVYKQFYTEWHPNSGYELADMLVIKCYMQENRQEV